MSRAWNDADRRRFADRDVLRAQTVPGRRFDGPSADEWVENTPVVRQAVAAIETHDETPVRTRDAEGAE
jgi:hypothetical protein